MRDRRSPLTREGGRLRIIGMHAKASAAVFEKLSERMLRTLTMAFPRRSLDFWSFDVSLAQDPITYRQIWHLKAKRSAGGPRWLVHFVREERFVLLKISHPLCEPLGTGLPPLPVKISEPPNSVSAIHLLR